MSGGRRGPDAEAADGLLLLALLLVLEAAFVLLARALGVGAGT